MFTLDAVTLRPLEPDDMDCVYAWFADIETGVWGGWASAIARPLSRHAFRAHFEQHLVQTRGDQVMLGIEFEKQLVGFIQLAMIDLHMRRAALERRSRNGDDDAALLRQHIGSQMFYPLHKHQQKILGNLF